jgi:anti-anti-sigma factor
MSNESTAVRKDPPQPPLLVPTPRPPSEAQDLRVDVLSTAPLVVGVSGEIDIASAQKLREELLGALRRHGARLSLDLGGVTFMDCAGINVLIAVRRRARLEFGWVRVARVSRRARNILMLAGLHREFALAGSETAAASSARSAAQAPWALLAAGRSDDLGAAGARA